MPTVNELVPMEELVFEPNTFIAVDVELSTTHEVKRLVGTVTSVKVFGNETVFSLKNPDTGDITVIAVSVVKAGWWAPMGYRP